MTEVLELQELLQQLTDAGHGNLIETLLMNETDVYTKKGRLNKSGACRVLGCKSKDLEDALRACRTILEDSY